MGALVTIEVLAMLTSLIKTFAVIALPVVLVIVSPTTTAVVEA
jgi:hypothetical protein